MKREELLERLEIRMNRWTKNKPDITEAELLQKAALFCEDEEEDIPVEILKSIKERRKYAETRESMIKRLRRVADNMLGEDPETPEMKLIWRMCAYCLDYQTDLPLESMKYVSDIGDARVERYREERDRILNGEPEGRLQVG